MTLKCHKIVYNKLSFQGEFMSDSFEVETKFSIEDLVRLTGLTRRTIRFYVQKGLLKGPEGEKRGAYYTTEHLEELLRIKRLSEKHVPLKEIKAAADEVEVNPDVGRISVCSHICVGSGLTLVVDHSAARIQGEELKALASEIVEIVKNLKANGEKND